MTQHLTCGEPSTHPASNSQLTSHKPPLGTAADVQTVTPAAVSLGIRYWTKVLSQG